MQSGKDHAVPSHLGLCVNGSRKNEDKTVLSFYVGSWHRDLTGMGPGSWTQIYYKPDTYGCLVTTRGNNHHASWGTLTSPQSIPPPDGKDLLKHFGSGLASRH